MTCYIHIGLEKTGTTQIQDVLRQNTKVLYQNNLYYPCESIHSRIQVLGYIMPKQDDPYSMLNNITAEQDLKVFKEHILADIKQIISENLEKNILFSHELIQSRLTQKQEISHFKENLELAGFREFKIILYIRNQADLFSSMCSQSFKNGLEDDWSFLYAPGNDYIHFVCNHKQTLQWWGEVFGRESLCVRIFDSKEFFNGSLISDFLNILGLTQDFFTINSSHSNLSLSVFGAELCRRINRQFPWFINGQFNRQRGMLTFMLDKYFCHKDSNEMKKFMPAKNVYVSYLDYYLECNEWVRKEFFSEKRYLFEPTNLSKYEENYEVSDISEDILDSISNCIVDISKKVYFENTQQKQEKNKIKRRNKISKFIRKIKNYLRGGGGKTHLYRLILCKIHFIVKGQFCINTSRQLVRVLV